MYHICLRFHLSLDLVLGLCLGNWRYHCSEHWGTFLLLHDGFSYYRPGESIRILGLAVLKFFLLACGGCPFKGLFPMSVLREHERGFLHLVASVQLLSCVRLCHPMDCSTPGLPVHHQFPELAQTHVHCVGDAIQPSHPLSSPFPPTFDLS